MAPSPLFEPPVFVAAGVVAGFVLVLVALAEWARSSRRGTSILVMATTVVDGELLLDGVIVEDDSPLGPRGWPVTVQLDAGCRAVAEDRVIQVGAARGRGALELPSRGLPRVRGTVLDRQR
jgi:hypothetical protein